MQYQPVEFLNRFKTWQVSDESSLYPLWQKQQGNTFTTSAGSVTILDPGMLNPYSGPDFRNAAIRYGSGKIQYGDIEIHMSTDAWRRHKHKNNPGYSNVILHVVQYGSSENVPLNDIQGVPTLVLGRLPDFSKDSCIALANELGAEAFDTLVGYFSRRRWETLKSRLRPAAKETIIKSIIRMADPKNNRTSITKLQNYVLESIVSNYAVVTILNEMVAYTDQLKWVMGRKRPGSHPRYRVPLLTLLAILLTTHPERVNNISFATLKEYCKILKSRGFLTPGKATLEEIIGNIVLPLTAIHSDVDLYQNWAALPTQIYGLTRRRLKIWNLKRNITFGYQQGLLQLEKECCRLKNCENCPLINNEVLIA